jgi:3-isopropylmalate dehydrogenase
MPSSPSPCATVKNDRQEKVLQILILPGDGIGPEITDATLTVLERARTLLALDLDWHTETVGLSALERQGTTLPDKIMAAARAADGIILGPISHLDYPARDQGGINVSAELRVKLDLFANIRPAKSRLGVGLTGKPVDLVIFRESTEGFYADRNMHIGTGEFMPTADIAIALRKVTARQCERIARAAFAAAQRRRRRVTAVHKANVLRVSDGLFLREVRRVAQDFPDVELDELLVDAAAAMLLRDPARFDCIVTTNMFGDILSDEAAELAGSLGLAASINAGDNHCAAQAQHGSAPDIAGQDRANPTSLILSAAMLLDWLAARHRCIEFRQAAAAIESAVNRALQNPSTRTPDLGGPLGTSAFARAVAEALD